MRRMGTMSGLGLESLSHSTKYWICHLKIIIWGIYPVTAIWYFMFRNIDISIGVIMLFWSLVNLAVSPIPTLPGPYLSPTPISVAL